MLLSADFIRDLYEVGCEAAERNGKGAIVIRILLSPTDDLSNTQFGLLRSLPENLKPVTKWQKYDEAFADIAMSLRRIISTKINNNFSQKETVDYAYDSPFGKIYSDLRRDSSNFLEKWNSLIYSNLTKILRWRRPGRRLWLYVFLFVLVVFAMTRLTWIAGLLIEKPYNTIAEKIQSESEPPERLVEDYFFRLEKGDYKTAWNRMSLGLKKIRFDGEYAKYKECWNEFKQIKLERAALEAVKDYNGIEQATVRVEWRYYEQGHKDFKRKADLWLLRRDDARQAWRIVQIRKDNNLSHSSQEECY